MDDPTGTEKLLLPKEAYEPPRLIELGDVDELTTRDGVSVTDNVQ